MSRRPYLADLDPQRICIIKPSAFGCVVQALPLLAAIRRRFSGAAIGWVIRDDLLDLVSGHPDLAECLVYRRREGPRAFLRLLRQLRSRDFDLAIDLQGLLRSGLMALATRAPVRVGLESAREGAALVCNVVIAGTGRDVPAANRYWRLAEVLGVGAAPQRPTMSVPQRDQIWARSLLAELPRPIVAVHPGAMWETKRCPPELFAAVLARASARFGGAILFVGTAADVPAATRIQTLLDERRSILNRFSRRGAIHPSPGGENGHISLAGATSLKQLAALLAGVDVLLCNDSGPMHLAAAMGTPVVGMFTCTDPVLSGPQGSRHQLICADVPCAAGYHKSCPRRGTAHLLCHYAMPVERICQALERVLADTVPERATLSMDHSEGTVRFTASTV